MSAARRTIYIVEEGEYSSYGVECAFEREEDAQAAVAAGFGDNVAELVLFGPGELPRRTVTHWEATAICAHDRENPPGTYPACWDMPARAHAEVYVDSRSVDPGPVEVYAGRPKVTFMVHGSEVDDPSTVVGFVKIRVKAATREEALKVCSDAYAKRRAERDGL